MIGIHSACYVVVKRGRILTKGTKEKEDKEKEEKRRERKRRKRK